MGCRDVQKYLSLYRECEVTPEVKKHLASCPYCQRVLEEYDLLHQLIQSVTIEIEPPSLSKAVLSKINSHKTYLPLPFSNLVSIAAALLIIVVSVYFFSLFSPKMDITVQQPFWVQRVGQEIPEIKKLLTTTTASAPSIEKMLENLLQQQRKWQESIKNGG